jgi:hypothetical protein
MSKKRIIGKNYTKATASIVYKLDASQDSNVDFFNLGGYSFVLEDSVGNKVRFYYITTNTQVSYFDTVNNMQPRYIAEDSSQPYFSFDSANPFFGENAAWQFNNPDNLANPYLNNTPVRIKVDDLMSNLITDSNPSILEASIQELIDRTVRAINYTDEIGITATVGHIDNFYPFKGAIDLEQDVAGISGNTEIDRNENAVAGSHSMILYGILSDDVITSNFTGVTYTNVYSERSGSVSNAIKKEINRKSFIPGVLPSNKIISGNKLTREKVFFDDSLTCIFKEETDNNSLLGVPISSATIAGNEELFFSYNDIDVNSVYDSSNNVFKNEQLLLKNTGIYSKPNVIDFQTYSKDKSIQKDSLDKFIEQKRVVEDYTPYKEDFGYFTVDTETDFETKNINNDINYNIKDQKQITISLDFSTDAYLANTAIAYNDIDLSAGVKDDDIHYTKQINFLEGNKKAVSSNSFPTAYWNFVDNRWEYLDIKSTNLSETGFVEEPHPSLVNDYKDTVFPAAIQSHAFTLNNDYDFRNSVKNNLLNKPICFSPSFRDNSNTSFLMQPTTSYGFPQKVNWQPHNNHILKMSDYIDENFIVEKVIIKGKLSANFEKTIKNGNYGVATSFEDFNSAYPLKQLSDAYESSIDSIGFSFFILNQRKNSSIVNESVLTETSCFYTEALKTVFDPNNDLIDSANITVYSDSIFANNSDISSRFGEHAVYQFDNKHNDFYEVNSNNNSLNLNSSLKNKFYYLQTHNSLSSNSYEQFLYKDIDWSAGNYDYDLTTDPNPSTGSIKIFNITDSYPSGVKQEPSTRELVSFSNLLVINSTDDAILNQEKYKNIDAFINTDNNSVASEDFTIKTNLKSYNASNFIDESKYSLLSNKTNTYTVREGVKSSIHFELAFDPSYFLGDLNNFVSDLFNFNFNFALEGQTRFYLGFNNQASEPIIYVDNNFNNNYFNLFHMDSNIWKTVGTDSERAEFNFVYFTALLLARLNLDFDILKIQNGNSLSESVGRIYFNPVVNPSDHTLNKKLRIVFEAKDENTLLYTGSAGSALTFINLSNPQNMDIDVSIEATVDNEIFAETDTLENTISIFEGSSKGKENFVGINSDRIIQKSNFNNTAISNYENSINYSFYKENTKNSVINTNYLLKPEDELIFGINSYGNGDLIASLLQLHDNLDITIIGRTQEKEERLKTNESRSIKRVLKESNKRKTNIEGTFLTKNNYFSRVYNTDDFRLGKKVIGDTSTNEYGNWSGFVNLIESNQSSLKTRKKYYYDSILPNFVDIFSELCSKEVSGAASYNISFTLDDVYIESEFNDQTNHNKQNILFKENWLKKYIFNNFQNFNAFRNVDNTINGSLHSQFLNITPTTSIDVNINKDSYRFKSVRDPNLAKYTIPHTHAVDGDILPLKIKNNSKYDFIDSDSQIILDTARLSEYGVVFSIQKPRYFNKWLLVIHDSHSELVSNSNPIYTAFKTYLEQGEDDYEQIGVTNPNPHLVSSRSIPLTLNADGVYFSKQFKVFYGTDNQHDFNIIDVASGNHASASRRTFFTELEYWEVLYLNETGFDELNSDEDRPASFGGDNTGYARDASVYDQPNFVTSKIQKAAYGSNQMLLSIGISTWDTIYDFGETISNTFGVFYGSIPTENNCSLSISRYKLSNPLETLEVSPVLEKLMSIETRYNEDELIMNSIQSYVNKSYLEDNIENLKNFDSEFDHITNTNRFLNLNEKVYVSDAYHISPKLEADGSIDNNYEVNMVKTDVKFVYKYIKNNNNLDFPYIKVLAVKSNGSLLNTKFVKESDSVFLPKKGKLRIYDQQLLDLSNKTGLLEISEVPYFEINLHTDDDNEINFDFFNLKNDDTDDLALSTSRVFLIKSSNEVSPTFDDNYLLDTRNHEQHGDFDSRDRKINNFLYTFGEGHDKLPYNSCEGFKFGVLNGHRTSPTYKFNAYNYGHFADFIAYSTNAAYVKKDPNTGGQLIEYAAEKVFVDSYYNVVSTSANTYNKDAYSRCSYPYIEDASNELSQLHVQ